LHASWIEAGQPADLFWRLTLREVLAVFRACHARREYEFDVVAWASWTTSYLTAYAPQKPKDFPKLEKLTLARRKKPRPAEDWQTSLKRIEAWVGSS
jgi:hypothetical protein